MASSPLRDELLDGLLAALAEVKVGGRGAGRARERRLLSGAGDFLESGGAFGQGRVQIEDIFAQAL